MKSVSWEVDVGERRLRVTVEDIGPAAAAVPAKRPAPTPGLEVSRYFLRQVASARRSHDLDSDRGSRAIAQVLGEERFSVLACLTWVRAEKGRTLNQLMELARAAAAGRA